MLGSKLAASRAGGPAFRQGEGAMRCGEARMLAADVRFVIRYDHRDTGRSVTYPSRRPWIHGRLYLVDYSRVPARILGPCWGITAAWPGSLGTGAGMTFGKGNRNVALLERS